MTLTSSWFVKGKISDLKADDEQKKFTTLLANF